MKRLVHRITIIAGLSILLVGCASIGPATPLAVTDLKSLSGTWEGIVYLPGSERDEITLTIDEGGSYDVVSKRSLGVSTGRGHIVIRDGSLVIEDERGRGAGIMLRNPAGDVLIKVDLTLSDNSNLSAKLWCRP